MCPSHKEHLNPLQDSILNYRNLLKGKETCHPVVYLLITYLKWQGACLYIFGTIFLQCFSCAHLQEKLPNCHWLAPWQIFFWLWSHQQKSSKSVFYFPTTPNPTFRSFNLTFKPLLTFIFIVCLFPKAFNSCSLRDLKTPTCQIILLQFLFISILGNFSWGQFFS